MKNECVNCRWFKPVETLIETLINRGLCTFNPPVMFQFTDDGVSYGKTKWPVVDQNDECSKFENWRKE